MLQAYRLQQGNETLSYQADEGGARRAEIGRADRPRAARSRRNGWWLRSVVGTGDRTG